MKAHFQENPKVESLHNVSQSLRCAVIALDGHRSLYQTSQGEKNHDENYEKKQAVKEGVRAWLCPPPPPPRVLAKDIIGVNQNYRMLLQERHVESTPDDELMFEALKNLIGDGVPKAVIDELEMEIPYSHSELNIEQKKVAHPLLVKTAMEVAGPRHRQNENHC